MGTQVVRTGTVRRDTPGILGTVGTGRVGQDKVGLEGAGQGKAGREPDWGVAFVVGSPLVVGTGILDSLVVEIPLLFGLLVQDRQY